ncbi:MAG: glycosyltransferase [Bacteroidales bacterium]|jgi:GT2 family glycosyltransferase|nr:glycosyltransferase [Bacteroidales bacterium]
MNKISIGILSYKRTDLLVETIKNIVVSNYEIDLIILNNNKDIDIKEDIDMILIDKTNITMQYIWFHKNLGVATGRREILFACKTDIIIMLDDDVVIPSIDIIISNVINEFESDKTLGGVAFNIIDIKTNKHNRYEMPHKNKNRNMEKKFYTYLMIGAGHALQVSKAIEVGNYPDDFGLYGAEEIDLSFRLINSGYKIIYNPDCKIIHKKSPDGRFSGDTTNYQAFVNRTKIAKRYFKLRYFITCFFVRSIYFLYKTKNMRVYIQAAKDIFQDKKRSPFTEQFYKYVKSVEGFLYY